ncbi:MAG TPA: RidA family protein [Gammaproteobacteria bacterium]|nr:RidA family protein [Gammaproteobacteria bacterium]HIA95852.1 RidA family protein [Gammaproteobacteria bacterium]HIO04632.1 RidA family protein [Gammaproteobacteria bacterium]HIO42426.1 RidA family protein [Gammaproteobacteria bacterium]
MMKKKIETDDAPRALGTYSQAIEAGNTIYLSGQIPLDPKTMKLVEGNENQIRQVFKNIQAVCESSEVSLNEIVKLNVYLSDLSVFSLVNEVMKELFSEPYPARAAIQVAKLPLDSLIEVEGIIVKK